MAVDSRNVLRGRLHPPPLPPSLLTPPAPPPPLLPLAPLREVFEAEIETRKVTDRLKQIMPMSVVQRLQAGQSMIADQHEEVGGGWAVLPGRWLGG